MANKQESKNEQDNKERKSIFESLFSRGKRDKEYVPNLKNQWSQMTPNERVKFILGAVFGLILFVGSIVLVYLLLMRMMG